MIQLVKGVSVKEDLERVGIDGFQDNQDLTNTDDVCNHDAVKSGRLMDAVSVNDVHQADSVDGVTIRRKLIEKGTEYQQKILFDKRKNLHAKMTRMSKVIDDLMYS